MSHHKALKSLMLVQTFLPGALGHHGHTAGLVTQGQPVIKGAAADGEPLVRLHFAQTAIYGCQNA